MKFSTYILLIIFVFILLFPRYSYSQIKTTYQAEQARFYKAKIESEHAGFSGTGYVNFDNEPEGYIEWTIFMANEGTQKIYIRYANGGTSNRQMKLSVNGTDYADTPDFVPTNGWTDWQFDSTEIQLSEGRNNIRLTGITADGGPNIDEMEITGEAGQELYELKISYVGSGEVTKTPYEQLYQPGTLVTLNATPAIGWSFLKWSGDINIEENPIQINMNSDKSVSAIFISEIDTVITFDKQPIGFASVNSLKQNGTNGGFGGDTVTVKTGAELSAILIDRKDSRFDKNNPPLVIMIEGKLTWGEAEMMDVKETYDLTIMGKGNDAQIEEFGLNIYRSHNIIIRNIEFRNCHDDAVNITDSLSHHIWIDHCTFSDDPESGLNDSNHDGLLDVKNGASYVTISWNHFYNHTKTCLLGHSDNNGANDINRLKVTYHHNWFDNTNQRHPRVRFGECHVFNNFYDNSKGLMSYGVASTMEADVVVEANYFKDVSDPTHVGQAASAPGDLIEINNIFENSGEPQTRGESFNPRNYYEYLPDDPSIVPALLMKYAGSGKVADVATSIKSPDYITRIFELYQNYPNPFNPATIIKYSLLYSGNVKLVVYNVLGEVIKVLVDEVQQPGQYSVTFDGSDLCSGIYLYRITSGNRSLAGKMILSK